jgi:hypothetical protein
VSVGVGELVPLTQSLLPPFLQHKQWRASSSRACQLRPSGLLVLLPLLIVFSTFLSLLLLFLICILLLRRRRGIALHDNDGPIDMSRDDLVQGQGGL